MFIVLLINTNTITDHKVLHLFAEQDDGLISNFCQHTYATGISVNFHDASCVHIYASMYS